MLAARTGLSPVMAGRAAELARLRELATATGDPAVALVSGEAGIGKTRLVAELVAILDPAMPALAGQGSRSAPGQLFQPAACPGRPQAGRPRRARVWPGGAVRAAVALVRELAGPGGALLVVVTAGRADPAALPPSPCPGT
jgi:hypothetical protein